MDAPCLLGIDIGTSSTKAILITLDGEYIGHAQKTYGIDSPHPGWAEQNPWVWLDAVFSSTRQLVESHAIRPGQLAGIGLSGQMHGAVCVSEAGQVLRPAIIWADQRTEKQVSSVLAKVGKSCLAEWTGNPVAPGYMLPSWLWLLEYEPEVARQLRWLLLPKDYIRFALTGKPGSEPSDASSTLLFNPAHRNWSTPLIDALGLDAGVLPSVSPSASVAGVLLPEMAVQMGLGSGIPVIFGGSDQAMQAVGNGVIEPGVVSSTIGTGGQLFAPTDVFVVDTAMRMQSYCHVLPDTWHVETAILSAGLSLKWLKDNVLKRSSYQELADAAMSSPPCAGGVIFAPYLLGERTPHMDARARGCLVGLARYHNRTHIIRAVMEGVVYALRQGLELMKDLGVPVDKVVASGGAAAHPMWIQLQADIYNRPVYRSKTIEAAAFGAAVLAGVGVGYFQDVASAVRATVSWENDPVLPLQRNATLYAQGYNNYAALYSALKAINHSLSEVT